MSTKNNALIGAVAFALGLTVQAGVSPICDSLLNDVNVTGFGAAEVDTKGRVMVLVTVTTGAPGSEVHTVRPVADALGNIKLFSDGNAAVALAKRTAMASGVHVIYVKADKVATVGDPVAALKSKYKAFKNEAAAGAKQVLAVTEKKTAAVALGWDAANGTPENLEYLDIVARLVSIGEWKANSDAKVAALAASLTAAGIDPVTVV